MRVAHVDEKVYLPSLIAGTVAGDDGCVLAGHEFTGCTIYGPAVVRFLSTQRMENVTIAGQPRELVIADDREQLTGVIGIDDCVFSFCRFTGISFSCPTEELDDVLTALSTWVT